MKIGDLVITKTHRHVGCIIDIKKQRWAGICAKVLFFKSGKQGWRKMGNLEPLDKIHEEGYNGFTTRTKNEMDREGESETPKK